MKEAFINLLKVKSIWSLTAAAMFCYLTVSGKISGEIAMSLITAIVTYYFTKKEEPKAEDQPEIMSDGLVPSEVEDGID